MSHTHNWEIQIQDKPASFTKNVYIFRRGFNGETELLQPDLKSIGKLGDTVSGNPTPTFELDPEIYQLLVDALHNVKSSPALYTDGKLEATEAHLKDLRQLLNLK